MNNGYEIKVFIVSCPILRRNFKDGQESNVS
jgi:hypothetical protein